MVNTPGAKKPRQHINANVEVSLYEKLRGVAYAEHTPMNTIIVAALERYLAAGTEQKDNQ